MPQNLNYLTPRTAAGNSTDIVITETPATIFAYTLDGQYPSAFQANIYRKVGSNYQLCPGPVGQELAIINKARLEWTIYAPGVYRVTKGDTPYPLGFGIDSP